MIKTIGYVTASNPFVDRRDWSGLKYKIREAIELAGFKVEWIPYHAPQKSVFILKIFLKFLYGRKFEYKRHPLYYKLCAGTIDKSLINRCDSLFFPGGAQLMTYLNYKKPVLYYVDATYDCLAGYYTACTNNTRKFGNLTESRAINSSSLMFHASEWSRSSAINTFGSNPDTNYVLEFGANIDDKDIVNTLPYDGKQLNILFSGVDWYRKGAPQAIDAVRELNIRGIKAKLFLCGIREVPKDYLPLPDFVENCGFLNKNVQEQYDKYISIIKQSHIFLLPTSAECAGIVFSESSAYGLPIFTYSTGGVGNYVIDGVNGYKLPLGAKGSDFADAIQKCIENGELLKLSQGGKGLFSERLSWKAWARNFKYIIETKFNYAN